MRRTTKPIRRAREGAVVVEAVIALSAIVLMCGLITFLHDAYAASLRTRQQAREEAWRQALTGCTDNSGDAMSLVDALRSGELPIPDTFSAGQDASGHAQRSISGFGGHHVSITRDVNLPCNTRASQVGNAEGGQWVFDLFM